MLHPLTLGSLGLDPLDPMGKKPVDSPISLSTYGAYWAYIGKIASGLLLDLERSAFDYVVHSGNAPDVFGSFIDFAFKTYYLWFLSFGDVVVEYHISNADKSVYLDQRQYLMYLESDAFRIRNLVAGTNVPYQLVIFR